LAWLEEANLKRPVVERLLYGVLLIKAVALALREVPELNSTWKHERLHHCSDINVGVAISLRQGGLVAPALLNTDEQTVDELMKNFRDLVKRARSGSLRSSELSEPTITLTSLGERGAESVFGIIYPPQVAIVGLAGPLKSHGLWKVNSLLGLPSKQRFPSTIVSVTGIGAVFSSRQSTGCSRNQTSYEPGRNQSHRLTNPGRDRPGSGLNSS
jgi:hypothetical protein